MKKGKKMMTIGGVEQYLKAVRRADRLREIEMYGKVISTRPPMRSPSKKAYNRKNNRKAIEDSQN